MFLHSEEPFNSGLFSEDASNNLRFESYTSDLNHSVAALALLGLLGFFSDFAKEFVIIFQKCPNYLLM